MQQKMIDQDIFQQARAHQDQLTKPQGALGRLEDLACWFAARQGRVKPQALRPHIVVFAADHGVCAEGVSAFPSVVTGEMVKNFAHGGAAINVLARQAKAELTVVDVGVSSDVSAVAGIAHNKVRQGTANLLHQAAMDEHDCNLAMQVGRNMANAAINKGATLLIAGDMGIGNTTASACLICRLTGAEPEAVVGLGTGIDAQGHARKIAVVRQALARVQACPDAALLAEVGGLEIAAMVGFYQRAAEVGVPILVDGFIATAAALAARVRMPGIGDWMLASHASMEQGHGQALQALGLTPLLDFKLRLGEGSGAALVIPLLQAAIALHQEMATFTDAGVSEKDG